MNLPHVLAIIGPLMAAGGASLAAYDVLRSRLRATVRRLFEDQGRLLCEAHLKVVARYRELPDGHSRREEWIKEGEAKAKSELEDAMKHWKRFEEEEQDAAFRFSIRGLIIIAIGSVFQSIAALMSP